MTNTTQTALFVATNLETWEAKPPIKTGQDRECEACGFRRLDPEYYAWLHARMTAAQKHYRAGRIPSRRYEELRARFNTVHTWAIERFGEQELLVAIKILDPTRYEPPNVKEEPEPVPPTPHVYPIEGDWIVTQAVLPTAITKVNAIREEAMSQGWSEAQLYQNRGRLAFPYGQDYGLVCFLDDNDQVGEITRQAIEIIDKWGNKLRFYNLEIDQPWLHHERANEGR